MTTKELAEVMIEQIEIWFNELESKLVGKGKTVPIESKKNIYVKACFVYSYFQQLINHDDCKENVLLLRDWLPNIKVIAKEFDIVDGKIKSKGVQP